MTETKAAEFIIEDNVPIPNRGIYPWWELVHINQSFHVDLPIEDGKPIHHEALRCRLTASVSQYTRGHNPLFKVSIRREGEGYRVWRTKDAKTKKMTSKSKGTY